MKFGKTFNELCTPARLYFLISAITIVIGLFNGFQLLAVFMNIGFVIVWTYLLNLLCKKGFKPFSWFLVLLPYFLILIGFLMTLGNGREGYGGARPPRSKEGDMAEISNMRAAMEKAMAAGRVNRPNY